MLGIGHGVQGDPSRSGLADVFRSSYSLAFNGTDEFIEINSAGDNMTPATAGTVSIWAIVTATSGSATLIRGKADNSNDIFIFWHKYAIESLPSLKGINRFKYLNLLKKKYFSKIFKNISSKYFL